MAAHNTDWLECLISLLRVTFSARCGIRPTAVHDPGTPGPWAHESVGHLAALREHAQRLTGDLFPQATYNVLRAHTDPVRSGPVQPDPRSPGPLRPGITTASRLRAPPLCRHPRCRVHGGSAPCLDPQLPQEYDIHAATMTFCGCSINVERCLIRKGAGRAYTL